MSRGWNSDNADGVNSAGLFTTNGFKAFQIDTEADTYTPPATPPAEQEDQFDTWDYWADGSYDPNKYWPSHVMPKSANVVYNSPTIVNKSQSGVKYTRAGGHTKWRLEVEYPPMVAEDFKLFAAIAQAAHGQSIPFFFKLRRDDGTNILWKDWYKSASTTTPRWLATTEAGSSIWSLGGFQSNEANVFESGEVVISSPNENGYLHTILTPQSANIYGEVKLRSSLPLRDTVYQWTEIFKDPFHAVVSLDSDNFEYTVDTKGYYYVSVAFDLDDWK